MNSFNSRAFWDGVDLNKRRYSRFLYLFINMKNAFKDLAKKSGLPEKTKQKEVLRWILRNSGREYAGRITEDKFFQMCKNLSLFSYISSQAKKEDRSLTDAEFDEKGLTENIYLTDLKYLSEFLAWAYNLQIPNSINDICSRLEVSKDPLELEKELAQLNSDRDLSDNPSPRFPTIIIIDNALYMEKRLENLENGLQKLFGEIKSDARLAGAIELYIATCGGMATEIVDFSTIDRQEFRLNDLDLIPYGKCMMASAINMALDKLGQRINKMKNEDVDVDYYCPWMIVLSDGKFGEDITEVCKRLEHMKNEEEIQVYPIGVTNKAKLEQLKRLDPVEAGILGSINGFFTDVFNSMKFSQNSSPGGTRVSIVHQDSFIKK